MPTATRVLSSRGRGGPHLSPHHEEGRGQVRGRSGRIQRPPQAERARYYDVVADLVAECVDESKGRISAKRLLPIARAAGDEGFARTPSSSASYLRI